ncbi:MAG: hypothetical protein AAGB51_09720 [Planctomycetota bacterium]
MNKLGIALISGAVVLIGIGSYVAVRGDSSIRKIGTLSLTGLRAAAPPVTIESVNGCRLAIPMDDGESYRMTIDYQMGDPFRTLLDSPVVFSDDGESYGYGAHDGESWRVVINEEIMPERFEGLLEHNAIRFSPDGARVIYGGLVDGTWRLYGAGADGRGYDGIGLSGPVFSPDSARVAFPVGRGTRQRMVVDGAEGSSYEAVVFPTFSPDSKRLAYIAKTDGQYFVVSDGIEGPRFGAVSRPVFSPDSSSLAYAGGGREAESSLRVFIDGISGSPYMTIDGPYFTSDSAKVIYVGGTEDGRYALVEDHEEVAIFDLVGRIELSEAGGHYGCVARRGDVFYPVIDGEIGDPASGLADEFPVFDATGQRTLFLEIGEAGRQRVIVDGRAGEWFDAVGTEGRPVFSPDSQRYAYAARRGERWHVVVDTDVGAAHDSIRKHTPLFGPGNTVVYSAVDDGRHSVYINGRESHSFQNIVAGPVIRADKHVEYLGTEGAGSDEERLYRVTQPLR